MSEIAEAVSPVFPRQTSHVLAIFPPSTGFRRQEMSAQTLEKPRFAEENGENAGCFSAWNRAKMLRLRRKMMRIDGEPLENRAKTYAICGDRRCNSGPGARLA